MVLILDSKVAKVLDINEKNQESETSAKAMY